MAYHAYIYGNPLENKWEFSLEDKPIPDGMTFKQTGFISGWNTDGFEVRNGTAYLHDTPCKVSMDFLDPGRDLPSVVLSYDFGGQHIENRNAAMYYTPYCDDYDIYGELHSPSVLDDPACIPYNDAKDALRQELSNLGIDMRDADIHVPLECPPFQPVVWIGRSDVRVLPVRDTEGSIQGFLPYIECAPFQHLQQFKGFPEGYADGATPEAFAEALSIGWRMHSIYTHFLEDASRNVDLRRDRDLLPEGTSLEAFRKDYAVIEHEDGSREAVLREPYKRMCSARTNYKDAMALVAKRKDASPLDFPLRMPTAQDEAEVARRLLGRCFSKEEIRDAMTERSPNPNITEIRSRILKEAEKEFLKREKKQKYSGR